MAKVTRSVLKDLVKECLVEILAEGLANPGNLVESRVKVKSSKTNGLLPRRRKHPTDFIEVGQQKKSSPKSNAALAARIEHASGGDDVLKDILVDTATRTLPGMIAADNRSTAPMNERLTHGDIATKVMADADPLDLFEGASNWAALAFPDAKSNTNS